MQLALLLAVLASILLAENAAPSAADDLAGRALMSVVAMAIVVAVAIGGSLRIARRAAQGVSRRAQSVRQYARLRRLHLVIWMTAVVVVSVWGHWPQLVRQNWNLDGIIMVADLMILLPIWLPLLVSWTAFYQVEHALESAESTVLGEERPAWQPLRFVALHARHYLGIIVLPVVLLLAWQDLAELIAPQWATGPYQMLVLLVPVCVLLAAFPILLRCLWQTESLPWGPLRQRIEQITHGERLGIRDIMIWRTEGRMTNAAVAGLVPNVRYLFLTDGLLSELSDDEIAAVVRHEAAHLRCHHLPLRMAVLALPVWLWSVLQWLMAGSVAAIPIAPQLNLLVAAIMIAYAILALGWYSRLLEHEADLWACGNGRGDGRDARAFVSALEKLAPSDDRGRRRSGWLHPSLQRRIDWMARAERDPAFARRLKRRTRWIARSIVALAISAPLVALVIHSALPR